MTPRTREGVSPRAALRATRRAAAVRGRVHDRASAGRWPRRVRDGAVRSGALRNGERNMSGANVVLPGGPAEAEISTAVLTRTGCRRGRRAAVVWSRWHMFAWLPAAVLGMAAWGAEEAHTVPYVPSAAAEGYAGLVRIESRSARVRAQVRVVAVDDAGQRRGGGSSDAGREARRSSSRSMRWSPGDTSLGLTGTGPGEGDWRLELTTALDIEARAYARVGRFPDGAARRGAADGRSRAAAVPPRRRCAAAQRAAAGERGRRAGDGGGAGRR